MSGTQTAPAHREKGRCESQAYFCVLQKGKQSSGGWGCFNGNAKWCGKKGREPSSWLQLIISSAGGWEDDSGVVKARGERWRGGSVGRLGGACESQNMLVWHIGEQRWGCRGQLCK